MDWFQTKEVEKGLFLTTEPAVHEFYRANYYTIIGRDFDLQVDFGCGIIPVRPHLPLSGKPVLALATHAHIDHIGGFYEFEMRLGHVAESRGFALMEEPFTLKDGFRAETEGPSLARLPHPAFKLADWDLRHAALTRTVAEGEVIDLGDRKLSVLHLPGHSPGGIGLLDQTDGTFFSGDAVYDGGLIDDRPGGSVPDYLATMQRLLTLDCRVVHAGHDDAFGQNRLRQICRDYIAEKH